MNNNEFTTHLYGKGQFQYSVDNIELPKGFIKYHKTNFSKYFKMKEGQFKGKKVLETGCGPGKHAIILGLLGADVTAIDLSKEKPESINQRVLKGFIQEPLTTDNPFKY